jgi:anaerobic dimethyl sulfoxide reductase subunit A
MKTSCTVTPVSCNLDCGAGCPLSAHTADGVLVKITESAHAKPFMRGCAKGYAAAKLLYHPKRLKSPLIRSSRRGEGEPRFRLASWDEALDLAAGRLAQVRDLSGPASVMRIGGSGSCRGALHNSSLLTSRFLSLFGGFTQTTGSYSSHAVEFLNPFMLGTKDVGIDVRNLFHSQLVVLWGFNPADTRFGTETEAVLRELKRRGTPVVVIDVRRTDSVKLTGGRWLGILPGGDAALAAALIWLLIDEGRVDWARMRRLVLGFDEAAGYITGSLDGIAKDPAWAEPLCGISRQEIVRFYREFVSARPAAVLPGLSIQRIMGGEDTNRLLAMLQLAAGNFGVVGGSSGTGQWNKGPRPRCGQIPVPENSLGADVPVNRWADAVLEGTAGGYPSDISLLYNVGGNFAVQAGDSTKVRSALRSVDTVITHEFFLTPTASWSDIVFPAAMFPERSDICHTNSGLLLYSPRAVDPPSGVKTDYEIFSLLARRLGFEKEFTEGRSEQEWLDHMLDLSEVDDRQQFFTTGIWEGRSRPYTAFEDFVRDPEKSPLNTPSGKVELVSEEFISSGGNRVPQAAAHPVSDEYPLRLTTPHEKFRVHSQFKQVPSLAARCDDRMVMHPEDAAARGIGDDTLVRLRSAQGEVTVRVRLSDSIVRGAVSLKSGWWEERISDEGLICSGTNTLTNTESTKPSFGSNTHTNAVEAEPAVS